MTIFLFFLFSSRRTDISQTFRLGDDCSSTINWRPVFGTWQSSSRKQRCNAKQLLCCSASTLMTENGRKTILVGWTLRTGRKEGSRRRTKTQRVKKVAKATRTMAAILSRSMVVSLACCYFTLSIFRTGKLFLCFAGGYFISFPLSRISLDRNGIRRRPYQRRREVIERPFCALSPSTSALPKLHISPR